jgi:uncharacterized protein (UPF0335 family)
MSDEEGNGQISKKQLMAYIERIERLQEEKKALGSDEKDVFAEAKSNGYNPKMMRKVISLRKLDAQTRALEEAEFEPYRIAAGLD